MTGAPEPAVPHGLAPDERRLAELLKNHILTPSEVHDSEGWNPRTGGDNFPPPGEQARPAERVGS